MTGHVTVPAAALAEGLPRWVTLLRAPNPGVMTLDGTNTWLLRAPDQSYGILIDPGPDDAEHLRRLAEQAPIGLILITHGHPDHVEGARRLSGLLDGAPVLAAEPTHRVGSDGFVPGDRLVEHGFAIDILDTPGHTADSVCFLVEPAASSGPVALSGPAASSGPAMSSNPAMSSGPVMSSGLAGSAEPTGAGAAQHLIFTGDTILGRGTTIVAHPDGNLDDYLRSLAMLGGYDGVPALPGHGPALADCAAAARFYLAHRHARLDQVRQAVAGGARTAADVVATVYADVDRKLWPAAEWSVRAQLAYLDRHTAHLDEHTAHLDKHTAHHPDEHLTHPGRSDRESAAVDDRLDPA